jgi:hypothetical protein
MREINGYDWANKPFIYEEQLNQPWQETHGFRIPFHKGFLYGRTRFVTLRRLFSTA